MSLPVVDPPDPEAGEAVTGEANVAGVLLAAGTSSRYGDANKLFAEIDGEPMVRRSARTLLDAGLDPVVVVVGHEQERVRDALADLDVTFAENPDYESGQASSVRTGATRLRDVDADAGGQTTSSELLENAKRFRHDETAKPSRTTSVADEQRSSSPGSQARQDARRACSSEPSVADAPEDAAVFALGDMPYVDLGSIRALVAAYQADAGSALAAGFEGERGNPVLFDARHFDALAGREAERRDDLASRDVGGKQVLLSADDAAVVETGDPGVRSDVDVSDDLE